MVTSACPSPLALERLASGESPRADLKAHVAGCAKCTARLEAMEQEQREFSQSPVSLHARWATRRADARWKRRAVIAAFVPVAAAAALAALPFVMRAEPKPPVVAAATVQPPPAMVQGRAVPGDLLEPRGSPPPSRLRELSLRGKPIAFGEGVLEGAEFDSEPSKPFILKHTEVQASVTGFVSSVTVTQEFENPFDRPVEAIYVFPLPDDAAVDEMTLVAGGRTLKASIQKREQARRMYEEAKSQGRRAALLDQERPNIFTQSVANLLPRERVKVSLRYVAPLHYDDGFYTFNFPMTVGPRFTPGSMPAADAEAISPPVERSGRDIEVTVNLVAGAPLEELRSVSHRMRVSRGDGVSVITLDPADRVPNKDFILRWRVTGPANRAAVISSGGPGGTFALMVLPKAPEAPAEPLPKEMVFVIDTSCSMAGPPLAAAKRAMRSAMEQMGPDDTFMLIDFADRASAFHDSALPNLPTHIGRAIAYLQALPASGGTNQLDGLLRALRLPRDPKRLREVLLMTDGFIGNESEIIAAAERELGSSRVFGFGIGSSVNHYLLSRLSQAGRGFYQYVRPDEDPEPAVERFVRRIERPMLSDLTLSWSGVEVFDVLPRKVPDLFDAQPVVLMGRYKQPGRGAVTLHGMRNGGPEELRVELELPAAEGSAPGLASLWARARIEELDMMQHAGELPEVVSQIQSLGLEHHLVTKYTSFVAVDDRRVVGTAGEPVAVPTLPVDQTQPSTGEVDGKVTYKPPPATPRAVAPEGHGRDPNSSALMLKPGLLGGDKAKAPPDGDAEFEEAFSPAKPDPAPKHEKTVWIPPAPGGASIPETLGLADIMGVIKGNIGPIKACVDEQRRSDPKLKGRLVMRWTVLPDGTVTKVEIMSEEFKTTYLAGCLGGLIKSWRFPQHLKQGEPVVFPFTF